MARRDDPMQLTTCLLRCHLSCNCRRENVVIIVVVVDDGRHRRDRRRPRQGSTLFEKTKHRNTAARSQVPQSVISGLQRRRRQRPTVFARSLPKAGLHSLCLPLRTAALDGQKRFVEVATRPPATSLDNNAKAP